MSLRLFARPHRKNRVTINAKGMIVLRETIWATEAVPAPLDCMGPPQPSRWLMTKSTVGEVLCANMNSVFICERVDHAGGQLYATRFARRRGATAGLVGSG